MLLIRITIAYPNVIAIVNPDNITQNTAPYLMTLAVESDKQIVFFKHRCFDHFVIFNFTNQISLATRTRMRT